MSDTRDEIDPILNYGNVPVCGFYTFGEKGLSDDGLPVYCNQSVSMLVFSDELNPVAALIHKGTDAYTEFSKELRKKERQIRAIGRINQLIQDASESTGLLRLLTAELAELLPWADAAFYVPEDASGTHRLACAGDEKAFPEWLSGEQLGTDLLPIWMESAGKRFGFMLLKNRDESPSEEDDVIFAQTIARLTAGGLHKLELDGRVDLKLSHLAILNRVGRELSTAVSHESPSHHILAYLRRILNLSFGSLWLIDQSNHLLVKEAFEGDLVHYRDMVVTVNDERIARWQMSSGRPRFFHPPDVSFPVDLMAPFPFSYFTREERSLFRDDQALETMDLLTSLSAQIAVFLENLSLQKHSTLYREVHHRIKNNLHNIAGLLRMQIRRLNRGSAEQALNDSIARIMSIAKVHETLSQADVGMIDLGQLVGRISTMALSDGPGNHDVSIDVSGSPILVPSKEATSIALVINELVQNAGKHGVKKEGNGSLSIRLTRANGLVELTVEDDGPGLPAGFDAARDGNLGLTIVNTVVKEELKGEFIIQAARGTRARVRFPVTLDRELR
ncbi:MAG: sensor histidine kinase [Deltaproteobacteria bacterium]